MRRATAFRDILSAFLEENAPETAPFHSQNSSPAPEFAFVWSAEQAPAQPQFQRSTYVHLKSTSHRQRPTTEPAAPTEPPPTPIRARVALCRLPAADQARVQALIALGATELADGVSEWHLKKAYRRLVKRLHPDFGGETETFLRLQTTYESLRRSLKDKLNAEACGNESASAEACRRPNAA